MGNGQRLDDDNSKQKEEGSMPEGDLEALRELEAVRARIWELSEMKKVAKEMRQVAGWMEKVAEKMLREVLERDDLDRVSRRIEQIRDEELTIAWNEMGVTDAEPLGRVELDGDPDDTCAELATSKSASNRVRCTRPFVTVANYGGGVSTVCARHKSAYERVVERVVAAFGDGVWDATPDYWIDFAD